MAMVVVDDNCLQADSSPLNRVACMVRPRVGGRLVRFYVHHMNRVDSVLITAINVLVVIMPPPLIGGALSDDAV